MSHQNEWSYTTISPTDFMAWCSVKAQGQLYLLSRRPSTKFAFTNTETRRSAKLEATKSFYKLGLNTLLFYVNIFELK